jgi:hypothetical protein
LELARARTAADLTRASTPAQRVMLERALTDVQINVTFPPRFFEKGQ